ncbi:hypothetical protein JNUCC1_01164 [Lentibacillus sp. JNUCC-1]|uniref:YjfB family protein n=1 Tax=Lentibacillus sp. JNUCC-1 TaxID=2654513 RepID=UPI0012E89F85|nr:YjfB family protein [Lentibacillus sp. JNUCC-1]MUV37358.1 hypothetical protein [Lentibacillus sp. JNUCC-1]
MDIAALSVVMANQQTKADASMMVLNRTKNVMEEQGAQLVQMLEASAPQAPHPNLGSQVDLSV